MTGCGGASSEPYALRDLFDPALYGTPNRNADGLTQVNPNLVSGETTCVILAAGQSTIANSGNGTYTKTNSKIHCLNIYNGGMYSAVNPLLGVTGTGENFLIRLADKMITAGKYQRVILVPLAIGSTNASNWAVGGFVNERLGVAALRTLALGLTPTYFIWQQGEADCALGTSQSNFSNSLTSIISTIRGPLPTTPIYISQTTMQNSITSSAIRAAQAAAVGGTVFAGPDTDSLTGTNRQGDGTHFTAAGNDALAGLWNAKLA
jgi:hypothetical protein